MNIQELEARFKEIDELSKYESVKVALEGETESTGKLSVSAERKIMPGAPDSETKSSASARDGSTESETLLEVDLGAVDVPTEYVNKKVFEAFSNVNTVGLLPGVKVMQPAAGRDYEVVEDYTYAADGYAITAPKGFVFDRASIPRIFWTIIDRDDLSNVPPLFHDLLYRNRGKLPQHLVSPFRTFERRAADDLFLELMMKTGVRTWRAKIAYQAVRKFGGPAWMG